MRHVAGAQSFELRRSWLPPGAGAAVHVHHDAMAHEMGHGAGMDMQVGSFAKRRPHGIHAVVTDLLHPSHGMGTMSGDMMLHFSTMDNGDGHAGHH